MRQIEVLQYTCPLCNAQLSCQAVDHYEEYTKTLFRCVGCLKEFYSQEKPHSRKAFNLSSFLMTNCEFCGKELHLSHYEGGQKIAVYDCTHCPVLTSFHFMTEVGNLATDNMRIKTTFMLDRNEHIYIWTNNYGKGISYITDVGVTLAKSGRDPLLIKFPKIMNINPQNVHEKFAFYIVFL
jgi:hypothetical protein